MPAKRAAGLLMFRRDPPTSPTAALQVLLVHPGGPLWAKRDEGVWTIPKGEIDPSEDALATAQREFTEETGLIAPGPFIPLGSIKQKSGKIVEAWACAGECDPAAIASNTFTMEWPPRSGKMCAFPEVDRAEFFTIDAARAKINPAQVPFLERLQAALAGPHLLRRNHG